MGGSEEAISRLHRDARFPALMERIRAQLQEVASGGSPPQYQVLSNMVWSMAMLDIRDEAALWLAAEIAGEHLSDSKPFELSAMLWAFAKLGQADASLHRCSAELFQHAADHVMENLGKFPFRCLLVMVSAFSTARCCDVQVFRGLASQMCPEVHTANCQDLAAACVAFADHDIRHDRLFSEIAQRSIARMNDFKVPDLLNVACSFARNGFYHKAFLEGAAALMLRIDLSESQWCLFVCAVSAVQPRHPATRKVILTLLPRVTKLVSTLRHQDLAALVCAVGTCFAVSSDGARSKEMPAEAFGFFSASVGLVHERSSAFGDVELAAIAGAISLVNFDEQSCLYPFLAELAAARADVMDTEALLIFMWVLSRSAFEASPASIGSNALHTLLAEAVRRAQRNLLKPQDLHVLTCMLCGAPNASASPSTCRSEVARQCLAATATFQGTDDMMILTAAGIDFCLTPMERTARGQWCVWVQLRCQYAQPAERAGVRRESRLPHQCAETSSASCATSSHGVPEDLGLCLA